MFSTVCRQLRGMATFTSIDSVKAFVSKGVRRDVRVIEHNRTAPAPSLTGQILRRPGYCIISVVAGLGRWILSNLSHAIPSTRTLHFKAKILENTYGNQRRLIDLFRGRLVPSANTYSLGALQGDSICAKELTVSRECADQLAKVSSCGQRVSLVNLLEKAPPYPEKGEDSAPSASPGVSTPFYGIYLSKAKSPDEVQINWNDNGLCGGMTRWLATTYLNSMPSDEELAADPSLWERHLVGSASLLAHGASEQAALMQVLRPSVSFPLMGIEYSSKESIYEACPGKGYEPSKRDIIQAMESGLEKMTPGCHELHFADHAVLLFKSPNNEIFLYDPNSELIKLDSEKPGKDLYNQTHGYIRSKKEMSRSVRTHYAEGATRDAALQSIEDGGVALFTISTALQLSNSL